MSEVTRAGGVYYCAECGSPLLPTLMRAGYGKGITGTSLRCMTQHCTMHGRRLVAPAEAIKVEESRDAEQLY